MKSKIAALDKFLEEKDHHIGKLHAIIQKMKERQEAGFNTSKRRKSGSTTCCAISEL